jgi:signal transduction histidine kinase
VYVYANVLPANSPPHLAWVRNNLAYQFILVAFGVLLLGMLAFGTWVSRRIEHGVADMAANSAALYVNSFIAPHLQTLSSRDTLNNDDIQALQQAIESRALRIHVTAVHVWTRSGRVVYSTNADMIGRTFPPTPGLLRAADGEVAVEFDDLDHDVHAAKKSSGPPLIEIYAPVRDENSGAVIAVLEFYERGDTLKAKLYAAEWHTWIVTGLITIAMMGTLFSIVFDGSKTIDQQRESLTQRIAELSDLLHQNEVLRARVERAARNATENSESIMRRLGSDLHDGPAQLIGLALLRLDGLKATELDRENLTVIRSALLESLSDVRDLCAGLVLPTLQNFNLQDALMFIVHDHERRTRTSVCCDLSVLPSDAPQFVKICLFRFVQEGLNNAFRHAEGRGQQIRASSDGKTITVYVIDRGPGIALTIALDGVHFGLTGLRDRIESIGGTMTINSKPGEGTRLTAVLPLTPGKCDETED